MYRDVTAAQPISGRCSEVHAMVYYCTLVGIALIEAQIKAATKL